ncbi:WD40 repeat-like protein [Auriscalpium vulgare]|uniref:WD40 repeat-like protein n=1 Tax=Auriscalpium vulgare TaxID=40419 RepID=A0ACB8S7V8_9AGAM|nr:WD40 repeat-like protein [Auriscalpium vulgare]
MDSAQLQSPFRSSTLPFRARGRTRAAPLQPRPTTPRFSKLFGTVLGSPFLAPSDPAASSSMNVNVNDLDMDIVDGALSAVPHALTITRPSSPSPSMDFSIISPPSPGPDQNFSGIFFPRGPSSSSSSFFPSTSRHRRFHTIHGSTYPLGQSSSSKSMKTLFPRLWDALSSPAKKGKGKPLYGMPYALGDDCSYADLLPLDGEEGELIDDEACFMDSDGFIPRGIDLLSLLPPEVSIQILSYLDFPSVIACQLVSRTWHKLADDGAVWRGLFHRRAGWGVDLERALARGWVPPNTQAPLTLSIPQSPSAVTLVTPSENPPSPPLSLPVNTGRHFPLDPSPWSPELPSPSCHSPSPESAPLSLPWRTLYAARAELDARWAAPCLSSPSSPSSARGFNPQARWLAGHADSVYCLEFDSTRIITGSRDQTIKVWDLASGRCVGTFKGHSGSVLCLKFEKDWDVRRTGQEPKRGFLVSGSSDRSVVVWDMWVTESGEVCANMRAVLKGHMGGVLDLRIDDHWIVSCSKDAVIHVWDRETLRLHRTLVGHEGPVNAVGLQNGRVVSASGDGKMMLWDIESGSRLRTFEGHDRGLACIEFKDDFIVSGSNDCKIKVWSAATGECLRTLGGHDSLVRALAVDPVSGRLVSASYDKTVRLWDLRTGRLIRLFRGHHVSHIFDVKFDVRRIMSTSHDQKIVVLDFAQELDAALFT